MQRRGTTYLAIAECAAFCGLFFWVLGLNDFSAYTDAGIHYAFAAELQRTMRWPLPLTSGMAGIAHYPPASHAASILIGSLAGSTLLGMFALTALSFATAYLALGELLRHKDKERTLYAFLIFLILSVVLRKARFVVGNEIIANFFFAQFVGTAALLSVFLFLRKLKLRFASRLTLGATLTNLIGWIYPISAIEFALACVAFEFMSLVRAPSWRSAAGLALSALLLGAAALVHPTLIGAVDIAGNDGGISVSSLTLVLGYVALLIGIAALFHFCRDKLRNQDTVVALSLGVLLACTLQALAFGALNLGSLYAVKKYGFLLGTMAIGVWSVVIAQWLPEWRCWPLTTLTLRMTLLFAVAGLAAAIVGRPKTPLRDLIAYDQQVKDLIVVHPELIRESVSWNLEQSAHVNYVIGVGVLQPMALMDQHAVFLPALYSGNTRYVIVEAGEAIHFAADCVQATNGKLTAIHSRCFSPDDGFLKKKM